MASPDIARLNAMLTATANGFKSTFAGAGKVLTDFKNIATGTGAKITAAFGAIGVGLSVAALGGFVHSQLEAIDTMKDQAEAIGLTTDALSRLQYATSFAGIESETLNGALVKMLNNIDAAAQGGGSAAAALKTLGIDAAALANMSADQQMMVIADALQGIDNAGQEAALAIDIFGKQGAALIPVLNGGADGLQKMFAESDALGNTVRQVDAAQVEAAADAMQRVGTIVTGIGRTLAIELAPYIEAASNQLVGVATSGEGMGSRVVSAVEAVVKGIAYATDFIELFKAGWYALKTAAGAAILGIVTGPLQLLASTVEAIVNLIPGISVDLTSQIKALNAELVNGIKEDGIAMLDAFDAFSRGSNSQAAAKFFDQVKRGAQSAAEAATNASDAVGNVGRTVADDASKVTEQIEKLHKQVAEFGKSDAEKLAMQLKEIGASDQQIAEATGLQQQLAELEALKKAHEDMASEAKKVWEETRTPAEKYADEINKLQRMLDAGAIDQDTFDRAATKAQTDLDGGNKDQGSEITAPKLLAQGSAEAASFIAQIQAKQRGANDPNAQVVKNTSRANAYLERIARNTGGSVESVVDLVAA